MKNLIVAACAAAVVTLGLGAVAPAGAADCKFVKLCPPPQPPPCIAQTNGQFCPQQ